MTCRSLLPAVLVVCLAVAQSSTEPVPGATGDISPKSTRKKADKKKKSQKAAPAPEGWFFGWNNRPRLGHSNLFQMDFRFKTQLDLSRVGEEADDDDDVDIADFRRTRVGIEGTFLRDFEYEVDAEVGERTDMLRDAFVNYRRLRPLQVQAGQFRVPFGRDQNTASHNLDFVFRSRPGTLLAPGRDVGVMVHGRAWDRRIHYQAGLFREDGRIPLGLEEGSGGGRTVAARLRNKPSSLVKLPKWLEDLEVGIAAARSDLPEGLVSLRGRTTFSETFFNRVFVKGHRTRTGAELEWKLGRFGMQGELLRARDQRLEQSVRGLDLPDLLSQGWYLQGTWVLTGEKKDGGVKPRRNFLQDGGWGALELAVRQEYLGFRSRTPTGTRVTSPRAANLESAGDRAWTLGVNWYANRFVKIQFNTIRERVDEPRPASAGGPTRALFWTQVCRIQFAM